jgi:MFS family permease
MLATTLIASVSALLGGALCDLKGRKVTGILGFVLLGMGYAILSFFSGGSGKELSQILYVIFDGTAWGILYVTFIFVIWGDVSEGKTREKYYLLGGLPFLFSGLIDVLVQPFLGIDIDIATSFSLASFFLFLAILPLLYAPETLSENTMKDRELKNYIKKARKEVAKVQNKEDESPMCENKDEEDSVEFKVKSEDDEKAQELAEKYY